MTRSYQNKHSPIYAAIGPIPSVAIAYKTCLPTGSGSALGRACRYAGTCAVLAAVLALCWAGTCAVLTCRRPASARSPHHRHVGSLALFTHALPVFSRECVIRFAEQRRRAVMACGDASGDGSGGGGRWGSGRRGRARAGRQRGRQGRSSDADFSHAPLSISGGGRCGLLMARVRAEARCRVAAHRNDPPPTRWVTHRPSAAPPRHAAMTRKAQGAAV